VPILKSRVLEKTGILTKVDKDTVHKMLAEILNPDF